MRMYCAKQRASLPVSTSWPATEHDGVSIGDGVSCAPAASSFVNSCDCAFCAAVTSAAIVCGVMRSEEHTSELQSRRDLVCRLLLEKKKKKNTTYQRHVESRSH